MKISFIWLSIESTPSFFNILGRLTYRYFSHFPFFSAATYCNAIKIKVYSRGMQVGLEI